MSASERKADLAASEAGNDRFTSTRLLSLVFADYVHLYCNERCSRADVRRLKNRPVLALRGMLFQPLSGSLLEAPDNNQGVFKFLYFFFGVVRFW